MYNYEKKNLNRTKTIQKNLLYSIAIFDSGSKDKKKKVCPFFLFHTCLKAQKM